MDGHTHGCYQMYYLLCYAVDNQQIVDVTLKNISIHC